MFSGNQQTETTAAHLLSSRAHSREWPLRRNADNTVAKLPGSVTLTPWSKSVKLSTTVWTYCPSAGASRRASSSKACATSIPNRAMARAWPLSNTHKIARTESRPRRKRCTGCRESPGKLTCTASSSSCTNEKASLSNADIFEPQGAVRSPMPDLQSHTRSESTQVKSKIRHTLEFW